MSKKLVWAFRTLAAVIIAAVSLNSDNWSTPFNLAFTFAIILTFLFAAMFIFHEAYRAIFKSELRSGVKNIIAERLLAF